MQPLNAALIKSRCAVGEHRAAGVDGRRTVSIAGFYRALTAAPRPDSATAALRPTMRGSYSTHSKGSPARDDVLTGGAETRLRESARGQRALGVSVCVMLAATVVLVTLYGLAARRGEDPAPTAIEAPSDTLRFRVGAARRNRTNPRPTVRYLAHTVRPGERLSDIARRYYGDARGWRMIARVNRVGRRADFYVGRRLMIPVIVRRTSARRPPGARS